MSEDPTEGIEMKEIREKIIRNIQNLDDAAMLRVREELEACVDSGKWLQLVTDLPITAAAVQLVLGVTSASAGGHNSASCSTSLVVPGIIPSTEDEGDRDGQSADIEMETFDDDNDGGIPLPNPEQNIYPVPDTTTSGSGHTLATCSNTNRKDELEGHSICQTIIPLGATSTDHPTDMGTVQSVADDSHRSENETETIPHLDDMVEAPLVVDSAVDPDEFADLVSQELVINKCNSVWKEMINQVCLLSPDADEAEVDNCVKSIRSSARKKKWHQCNAITRKGLWKRRKISRMLEIRQLPESLVDEIKGKLVDETPFETDAGRNLNWCDTEESAAQFCSAIQNVSQKMVFDAGKPLWRHLIKGALDIEDKSDPVKLDEFVKGLSSKPFWRKQLKCDPYRTKIGVRDLNNAIQRYAKAARNCKRVRMKILGVLKSLNIFPQQSIDHIQQQLCSIEAPLSRSVTGERILKRLPLLSSFTPQFPKRTDVNMQGL